MLSGFLKSWKLFKVSKRDTADRYYIFSLFGFGLFLHHLHHDEEKGIFHDHPWNGISFVFGHYYEQRLYLNQQCKRCKSPTYLHRFCRHCNYIFYGDVNYNPIVRRGWFRFVPATLHHRIELKGKSVWTLFFHFRRFNKWTVMNHQGKILDTEPWRDIGGRTSYKPNS